MSWNQLTQAERRALEAVAEGDPYSGCRRAVHFHNRGRMLNRLIDWRLVGANQAQDGIVLTAEGRAQLRSKILRSR